MKLKSVINNLQKYPYYNSALNDPHKDISSAHTHFLVDVVASATKQMLELVVVITRLANHFVRTCLTFTPFFLATDQPRR